jgi:hypothetical protein
LLHIFERIRQRQLWVEFSRGLFQEAFHAVSLNRPIALVFLAGQRAPQIFGDDLGNGGSVAQLILFGFLPEKRDLARKRRLIRCLADVHGRRKTEKKRSPTPYIPFPRLLRG